MRMMARFRFAVDTGNNNIRSGKVGKVFERLISDFKPEAMYLYPEQGERGGLMVFDMTDSSMVAAVVERLSFGLDAKVELVPVMNGADLQKGLGGIADVIKNYG